MTAAQRDAQWDAHYAAWDRALLTERLAARTVRAFDQVQAELTELRVVRAHLAAHAASNAAAAYVVQPCLAEAA